MYSKYCIYRKPDIQLFQKVKIKQGGTGRRWTDGRRTHGLSREQLIGIGTGGKIGRKNPPCLVRPGVGAPGGRAPSVVLATKYLLGRVQVYSGRGSRTPAVEGDWDLRLHAEDTT